MLQIPVMFPVCCSFPSCSPYVAASRDVLNLTRVLLQIPVMFMNKPVAEDAIHKLQEALGWLEGFFGDNQFVAGAKQTVADFAVVSTIATVEVSGG